jgi:uncharacterized hydrophobic protein (TIGR00271 family)
LKGTSQSHTANQKDSFVGEVRYSRDMRLFRAVTLGLGLILAVGIFTLLGPVAQATGAREPRVFLFAGVLFLPLALSLVELAAASGSYGVYGLARASERPLFIYFTGWALLAAGIAMGGLLVRSSADYLGMLSASLVDLPVSPQWLGIAVLLLITANNVLGSRENRWWQNTIVLASVVALLVFGAWALIASPPGPPLVGRAYLLNTSSAIALLSGILWGLVLILSAGDEMRRAEKNMPRALLSSLVLGSMGSAAIAAVVLRVLGPAVSEPLPLADIAGKLGGSVAQGWFLVIGLLVLAASLNRTLQTLARIAADMSREGFLPQSWRTTHAQFHTPFLLLIAGGILAGLTSLYADVILSAALAGLGLLSAVALVNLPTLLYRSSYLPDKRPFVLPFSPLIPGLAIAISIFLLTTLPVQALLLGAGWFLLGAIVYALYARRGAVAARTGVTIFREEPEKRAEAKYRILVAVANPATADALISVGSTLALAHGGEVLALQVAVVPEQTSLLAGQRAARQRFSLLDRAVKRAQAVGVPVYPIVRIAHSPVEGVLDTATEEKCDLILMGWRGDPGERRSYDLGPVIDEVVTQAPCDVAVLKGEVPEKLGRILVPTAGGPHAPAALQIGLDLAGESKAEIIALNLILGSATPSARQEAQVKIDQTLEAIEDASRVSRRIVRAEDARQGILEAAARCDLLLLGASEEGVLDQITFGGLPEDIARTSPIPVILVKRYRGLPTFWLRRAWKNLYALFPTLDRAEQIDVYRAMRRGARPDIDFFVLIVLSAVIATFGLLQNSAAVIIGAMLVAPLMTPILAASLGIVEGDVRLLRIALESTLKGITLALVVAVAMVLLIPYSDLTPEIMSRTHPTLLDLIVALASGAAGAYAIGRKDVAAALPGVAIAAALVPPLCVVGAGISLSRSEVAGGALLLFITNLISISLAGAIVFLLLGFRPAEERERQRRFRQGLAVSVVLLLAISVPLGFFLVNTVQDGRRQRVVSEILTQEALTLGGRLVESSIQQLDGEFSVMATYYAPKPPDRTTVKRVQDELSQAIRAPVHLEVVVVPIAQVTAD